MYYVKTVNLYEPQYRETHIRSHEFIRKRKTQCEVFKINLRDINKQ